MENYTTNANAIANNNAIATNRTIHTLTTRRYKAKCAICGRKVDIEDSARITTPSRPRGITLCALHANVNTTDGYSTENHNHVGTQTAKGITTSIELETEDNTITAKAAMYCDLGFYCTSDGSLDYNGIEYKSPIYDSLQACTKTLGTIEYLNNNGYFTTRTSRTSAHIHTGFYNDIVDFRKVYRNVDEYYNIFGGLYAYLEKMPNEKMKEYFGRGFVSYARTIRKGEDGNYILPSHDGNGKRNRYSDRPLSANANLYGTGSYDCTQHLLAFNMQHSYSIEFRLPVFINARQYRNCILAMQDLVSVLRDYNFKPSNPEVLVNVFRKHFPY